MSLTSGLHGPRVLLTIPNTFDDFVVISVICFAQDSLESIPVIPVIPVQRQGFVMSLAVGMQGQKAYGLCTTPYVLY